jgi:hypothetical protein
MIIQVKIKNIYGKDLFYPLNFVNELYTLTGNKTLSHRQIEALKAIGFTFEIKQNTTVL